MLQTYRNSLNPFYHKGIDQTLAGCPRTSEEGKRKEPRIVRQLKSDRFKKINDSVSQPTQQDNPISEADEDTYQPYLLASPKREANYTQYAPKNTDPLASDKNSKKDRPETRPGCSKNKDVDIAGLQSQAFRYLALEAPILQPCAFEKDKPYKASFAPNARIPDDLESMIKGSKMMRSKGHREMVLLNCKSLRSPAAQSRFKSPPQTQHANRPFKTLEETTGEDASYVNIKFGNPFEHQILNGGIEEIS